MIDYKNKVNVQAFAYQFPDCNKISVSMESVEKMKVDIEVLERNKQESYILIQNPDKMQLKYKIYYVIIKEKVELIDVKRRFRSI